MDYLKINRLGEIALSKRKNPQENILTIYDPPEKVIQEAGSQVE